MTLYRKYRPQNFDEMYGNEDLLDSLKEMLQKEDRPHSYLFHGNTGCGKTTLARIIARELGAKGNDFREVDSADFRGIDTVREMRKQSQYKALEGSCRVWLLDEVHKLSNDAMNALLKALEDTPKHVYYILCTTDPQKLLATIKGRCSQFQVTPLSDKMMFKLLRGVVKGEEEKLTKQIYEQIIQDSQGQSRDALQILEQVLCTSSDRRLEVAKRTAELQSQSIELCRALINPTGWKKIAGILKGLKDQDPERIRRGVLGYCQTILLRGENHQAGKVMEEMISPFYNSGFPGLVLASYSVVCGEYGEPEIPF